METTLRCPRCRRGLRRFRAVASRPETAEAPIDAGDIELDRCDPCKGTWFESGELVRLVGRDLSALDIEPGEPARLATCPTCGKQAPESADVCPGCKRSLEMPCPRCETPLHGLQLGDHHVEVCLECGGMWLDDGEAMAIAKAIWRREARNGSLACRKCGRTGLRLDQMLMSENGPVCEPCGQEMEKKEQPKEEEGTLRIIGNTLDSAWTVADVLDDLFRF